MNKKRLTGVNPAMSMVYVGCWLSHSPSSLLDTVASSFSGVLEIRDLVLGLCSGMQSGPWACTAA